MKKLLSLIAGIITLTSCQKVDDDALALMEEIEMVTKSEQLQASHNLIQDAINQMYISKGIERFAGKTDINDFKDLELIIDVWQNMAELHPEFFEEEKWGGFSKAQWIYTLESMNKMDELDRESDVWLEQAEQETNGFKWYLNKLYLEAMDEWLVKNIDADGIDTLVIEDELEFDGFLVVGDKELFRGKLQSITYIDNNGSYAMNYVSGTHEFIVRFSATSKILEYVYRPTGDVAHQISFSYENGYVIHNTSEDLSSITLEDVNTKVWVHNGDWGWDQFDIVKINVHYQFPSGWNFNQN